MSRIVIAFLGRQQQCNNAGGVWWQADVKRVVMDSLSFFTNLPGFGHSIFISVSD